jgi:hypothetical protein
MNIDASEIVALITNAALWDDCIARKTGSFIGSGRSFALSPKPLRPKQLCWPRYDVCMSLDAGGQDG